MLTKHLFFPCELFSSPLKPKIPSSFSLAQDGIQPSITWLPENFIFLWIFHIYESCLSSVNLCCVYLIIRLAKRRTRWEERENFSASPPDSVLTRTLPSCHHDLTFRFQKCEKITWYYLNHPVRGIVFMVSYADWGNIVAHVALTFPPRTTKTLDKIQIWHLKALKSSQGNQNLRDQCLREE